MSSHPDETFLERVLAALADARLEAVVVGSVAAALQGVPILTRDVDLLVRDTTRNREKLRAVCAALGAATAPVDVLGSTLRLVGAPVVVDVLFDRLPSSGMSFNRIRRNCVDVDVGARVARVACLEDVIRSKEATGRPKDEAQLKIIRDTLRVRRALEDDGP